MLKTGKIYGINGPVIYLNGNTGFGMSEMVYVGKDQLVGEVIALEKDRTTVQVYEETSGLRPGVVVTATGNAVSVTLAPGILNNCKWWDGCYSRRIWNRKDNDSASDRQMV